MTHSTEPVFNVWSHFTGFDIKTAYSNSVVYVDFYVCVYGRILLGVIQNGIRPASLLLVVVVVVVCHF